jgi:hypothetical protein
MMDEQNNWALALALPNCEEKVSIFFDRWSIIHSIFRYPIQSVQRGIMITRLKPAFPRYIFTFINRPDCFEIIRSSEKITGFVIDHNGGPATVLPSVMKDLFAMAPSGLMDGPPKTSPFNFSFGEKVRVFAQNNLIFGQVGLYQYPTQDGKAYILVPWTSGYAGTEIDERDLVRVDENENKRLPRRRGGKRHRRRWYHKRSAEYAVAA